jgi:hypothetical protein
VIAFLASACVLLGHGAYTRPSDACTPGHIDPIPLTQACQHRTRPRLPATERRRILAAYGLKTWTGADGELDHRQPFWLGGTTDHLNVWPEPGSIPNPKDRLEDYVYRRVCVTRSMRLSTARSLFRGDWVAAYHRYIN